MSVTIDQSTHKSVATWILKSDYASLQDLAAKNNVTVATYIRGIIVDAIQDELYNTINNHTISIQDKLIV